MLSNIKNWFFDRELKQIPNKKLNKKNIGSNKMQNIGVLFDASQETDAEAVNSFIHKLKNLQKNVYHLSFVNTKLKKEEDIKQNTYTLNNLKWHNMPFGEEVEKFCQIRYDMIFIFTRSLYPHFKFILLKTNSDFVIGPAIDEIHPYCDLMVENKKEDKMTNMIEQTLNSFNQLTIHQN